MIKFTVITSNNIIFNAGMFYKVVGDDSSVKTTRLTADLNISTRKQMRLKIVDGLLRSQGQLYISISLSY